MTKLSISSSGAREFSCELSILGLEIDNLAPSWVLSCLAFHPQVKHFLLVCVPAPALEDKILDLLKQLEGKFKKERMTMEKEEMDKKCTCRSRRCRGRGSSSEHAKDRAISKTFALSGP